MTSKISNAAAVAACNAVVDQLDGGSAAGYVEIRTLPRPANVDAAATGTLLGTLTCSDPAFGNAVDADPGAVATAAAITGDPVADNTGEAAWYRGYDSNGVACIEGNITLTGGGGNMELSVINIQAGGPIDITGWTVTMPEG